MDPDDLLADAVEGLLVRWADGGEEIASPRGYILVSMRNRVINEARSPRSRSTGLGFGIGFDRDDPSALGTDEAIELEQELAWLRLALGRLSAAHRSALHDGEVPPGGPTAGDSTDVGEPGAQGGAGRSADARQSLRARARRALRRAYLQVVLEEGASPACHAAIARLPVRVGDDPDSTGDAPEHFRSCERCRKRWLVFAGLAGGLGIAGAVAVPAGSAPARADGPGFAGSVGSAGSAGSAGGAGSGRGSGEGARGIIASGAALIGIGILLAAAAFFPQALRPWAAPGEPAPVGRSANAVGGGAGAAVTARMVLAVTGGPIAGDGIQEVTIRLTFDVAGSDWSTHELGFELPSTFDAVSASEGWSCAGHRCAPAIADAREGVFAIRGPHGGGDERIGVRWRAEAAGHAVTADASSSVPLAGETFTTSASDREG
ncbi:hypothetical protein GCM10009768_01480 [Leucobacter iarius]|uniref:RNA polymerase sigma factor (Sigma-70 family) n=2 Tax=Leucobacter iarius TaxID=333963 RepID=A0ABN2L7G8_9MICO